MPFPPMPGDEDEGPPSQAPWHERDPIGEANYDGSTYSQVIRLHPEFIALGLMLAAIAVWAIVKTWPEGRAWWVAVIAAVFVLLGFVKRSHFEATAGGYRVGWSVGPWRSVEWIPAGKASIVCQSGRQGYAIVLKKGFLLGEHILLFPGSRAEGERWVAFLRGLAEVEK